MKFFLSVVWLLMSNHLFSMTTDTEYKIEGLEVMEVLKWAAPSLTTFEARLIDGTHIIAECFTDGPMAGTVRVNHIVHGDFRALDQKLYHRIRHFYKQMKADRP